MALTAIKGFNDILPEESGRWHYIEQAARSIFELNGFSEIRVPVMEKTELFCRSIGDATDIVEKEMYTFVDKGENSVTLRPEGTAGVMRAFIEHKLYAQDPVTKLFYLGPMFRYERPQKGRYRQFHQIGAEITGVCDPLSDTQVLNMLVSFFHEIGLDEPSLQINSLGCPECRPAYRSALCLFLEERLESLCEDCKRRFGTNPLRTLDCKVPGCVEATKGAPSMLEHLCGDCNLHFDSVRHYLDLSTTPYSINPRMVRGLDYYTRTTFEVVTGLLGSQSAVAAGGRYDGLISQLGGPAIPGIGFAIGLERVALLLGQRDFTTVPDLFIATMGTGERDTAFRLMDGLLKSGVRVELDYECKSLKSQMRRADKLKARFSVVIGENEVKSGKASFKRMSDGSVTEVALIVDEIARTLKLQ
ncbi:MAG: histidine--tRNA ligase [Geobacteraceae bacterium GWC2_55_20]|nr:MAG: histidine--tRNA ligase [Geobacteraceae bacterium GWC2_55_20]OGU26592.1 MAG: histidine--tRNA ligase [Geobacteraceae bacterium GWF2_54_21]HBA71815.1 histidine--tRNA ligase [Geobacter sp.]HCE66194.1 histidine--tRNA ligase [Geobacter sp.]